MHQTRPFEAYLTPGGRDPVEYIDLALARRKPVLVTSLGPNSGIALHAILSRRRDITVLFTDTGNVPPSNFAYRDTLEKRLGTIPNFVVAGLGTPLSEEEKRLSKGTPQEQQRFNWHRKVLPMEAALEKLGADAVISGVRIAQKKEGFSGEPIVMLRGRLWYYPFVDMTHQGAAEYLLHHGIEYHKEAFPGDRPFNCGTHLPEPAF